jgi:16S rRNA (guanine527-N7)-methyltransferase
MAALHRDGCYGRAVHDFAALPAPVRERLGAYLDELQRWNARINLTAVAAEQAWEKHVGEVLDLLAAAAPAGGARVVDVGAGGGVPGIPLAVLRPDLGVVLLESDRRKAGFLTHVAGLLGLDGVTVMPARAEEVGREAQWRESFDLAVSRALAPPPVMCELTLPLVRVGGVVATLVGDAAEAAALCARAAQLLGGAVPGAAPGNVLLIRKVRATGDEYPRRAGVPVRKPLA